MKYYIKDLSLKELQTIIKDYNTLIRERTPIKQKVQDKVKLVREEYTKRLNNEKSDCKEQIEIPYSFQEEGNVEESQAFKTLVTLQMLGSFFRAGRK